MPNYRRIAKKLQSAIAQTGRIIKMNTRQFYSEEQCRLIDCYVLTESKPYKKKNGEIGTKEFEIFKSCSLPKIVKELSEIYKGGG